MIQDAINEHLRELLQWKPDVALFTGERGVSGADAGVFDPKPRCTCPPTESVSYDNPWGVNGMSLREREAARVGRQAPMIDCANRFFDWERRAHSLISWIPDKGGRA